ncbi:unnamed protein product [Owenia fusiformis]|uniref:Uncharacterized protein n=1 Tax=Owenia fusiformis TaxID=6347 RepID=A0A8S4P7C0_OWEFU|nr:unnamed protein product [Owenia fusiformis]
MKNFSCQITGALLLLCILVQQTVLVYTLPLGEEDYNPGMSDKNSMDDAYTLLNKRWMVRESRIVDMTKEVCRRNMKRYCASAFGGYCCNRSQYCCKYAQCCGGDLYRYGK